MPDGSYFDKTADVELVVRACACVCVRGAHSEAQVEGHRLPAHKLVLAMQSEVFHSSFAETAPTTERVLVLETCFVSTSISDIVLLLRYIYSLTPHEFLQNVCARSWYTYYITPYITPHCTHS